MVKYADRMNEMKASDVRELLKLTARSGSHLLCRRYARAGAFPG